MESSHSNMSPRRARRETVTMPSAETLTALQLPVKVYHRAVRVGLTVGYAARPAKWEGCIRPGGKRRFCGATAIVA
jgi:hypothetical protein